MRRTFANTIRKDLIVTRNRRGVTVTQPGRPGERLSYRSGRANADTAAYLNSKIPVVTIQPGSNPWRP